MTMNKILKYRPSIILKKNKKSQSSKLMPYLEIPQSCSKNIILFTMKINVDQCIISY